MLRLLALTMIMTLLAACSDDSPKGTPPAGEPAVEGAAAPTEPAPMTTQEAPPASASAPRFFADVAIDRTQPNWKQQLTAPAPLALDGGSNYYWELDTNKGPMRFRLLHGTAPMHVTSTIYLTELGFYDDVVFHRVIPGFMAQGGDPTGTGRGGPGYMYSGEFGGAERHDRPGLLSMANAGPGTDGSQFFITFVPTPWLDGKHTIFGEIETGMDTVKALEAAGSRGGKTTEPLMINKATISVEPVPTSGSG